MLWIKGVIKIGFDIIFFKKVLEVASSSSPNLKLSWILCWHVLGYLCWYLRNIGDIRDMSPNLALEISNSVGIWSRVSISVGIWTRGRHRCHQISKYRHQAFRGLVRETQEAHQGPNAQICDEAKRAWHDVHMSITPKPAFMWMIINFPDIDRKCWEASNVHFWSPWVWPLCNI